MNVDDAGSFNTKDNSRYYVLSGVVINQSDYKEVKKKIFQFKLEHFKDDYIDAEIHSHDLYNGQPPFSTLTFNQKIKFFDDFFKLIIDLPITIISVVIDKLLLEIIYEKWNVFNTAWNILFQRFDDFLKSSNEHSKGILRIDKSDKTQHKKIAKIVQTLQIDLTEAHKIHNVVGNPFFVNSEASELVQIADAVGYCTIKHMTEDRNFQKYWDLMKPIHYNKSGKIDAYGLNIFPKPALLFKK